MMTAAVPPGSQQQAVEWTWVSVLKRSATKFLKQDPVSNGIRAHRNTHNDKLRLLA